MSHEPFCQINDDIGNFSSVQFEGVSELNGRHCSLVSEFEMITSTSKNLPPAPSNKVGQSAKLCMWEAGMISLVAAALKLSSVIKSVFSQTNNSAKVATR